MLYGAEFLAHDHLPVLQIAEEEEHVRDVPLAGEHRESPRLLRVELHDDPTTVPQPFVAASIGKRQGNKE